MRYCLVVAIAAVFVATALLSSPGPSRAELVQIFEWNNESPAFGGVSGFDFSGAGTKFVAITDRAKLVEGQVQRDETGRIVDISARLRNLFGVWSRRPLVDFAADSEGLAVTEDSVFVSFEGYSRINRYDLAGGDHRYPHHPEFELFWGNGGMEALAVDAAGAVFAIPERSGQINKPFPVYRFRDAEWQVPYHIERSNGFVPVGADFGPDGRFYLLERGFNGFGFRSRVRVFTPREGAVLTGETVLETRTGTHDNLEGLSVWQGPAGRIRLTMVSDNNFVDIQRTEIVEYVLTAPIASFGHTQ